MGRIGAIAGPTYGALLVGLGGGVPVAAIAFAAPALLGAVLMLALRTRAVRQPAAPRDAELVRERPARPGNNGGRAAPPRPAPVE